MERCVFDSRSLQSEEGYKDAMSLFNLKDGANATVHSEINTLSTECIRYNVRPLLKGRWSLLMPLIFRLEGHWGEKQNKAIKNIQASPILSLLLFCVPLQHFSMKRNGLYRFTHSHLAPRRQACGETELVVNVTESLSSDDHRWNRRISSHLSFPSLPFSEPLLQGLWMSNEWI